MSKSNHHYSPPRSAVRDGQAPTKPTVFLIRLIAIFMAAMGVYWLYNGMSTSRYGHISIVLSVVPFVAAFGLWLKQKWSQYLVHLLSLFTLGLWFWQIWYVIQQPIFRSPMPLVTTISLVMSELVVALLVALVVGSSVIAFRFFRDRS